MANELKTFAGSRADPTRRAGGEDSGRDHHSRHRQGKAQEGEVIAVGPGARDEDGKVHPLDVKPGDRMLFGKWSGTEVKIDGEDLLIMKESDIMGVLEQSAKAA